MIFKRLLGRYYVPNSIIGTMNSNTKKGFISINQESKEENRNRKLLKEHKEDCLLMNGGRWELNE